MTESPRTEQMPGVSHLLYAKWCQLKNLPRSKADGGVLRALLFIALGGAVWAMFYGASHWFFVKTIALEPFGEILVRKLLSMTFMVIFSVLLFSSIIQAFSTYLLSDELRFILPYPVPPNALFSARFLETAFYSSWMVLLFGLPVFISAGVVFRSPVSYYLWLMCVFVPLILIPPALAVLVVLFLANTFPVQRAREVLIGLGVVFFIGAFIVIRQLQPEKLFNPGQFGNTMEFFSSLQTPGRYWLPSTWAIEVLHPYLRSDTDIPLDVLHLSCLYGTAFGAYFIAAWAYRLLYRRAYSRAQQGRHSDYQLERQRDGLGGAGKSRARRRLQAWSQRMSLRAGRMGPVLAIARKDAIVFTRDAVQWSQILLLIGLVVIYLVNFQYIGAIGKGGIFGPIGIHFLNFGLNGFLVAAVSVRIVFPAVSLEGRAFWLIRRSPIGLPRYLLAKWLGHTPHMLLLAEGLTISSHLMSGTPLWLTLKSVVVIFFLVVSLTGLGVGVGALFPRFNSDNAAKIATGFGGVLFMGASLMLTLGVIIIDAYPTFFLLKRSLGFSSDLPPYFWLKAGASWSAMLLLCLGSPALVIWLGARKLAKA
ncbi:MAG: hypothetical protein AUK47_05765 [Deltaproteobacteria bacterium CG2_30_63_29]|nr:MAG: hypothetical protein AUK47_05765 [Deltaproteobacteria bacterium CG2_30_63_29]PJB42175.1 MAG: hypothetical protein CO108_12145 [Deltaproteobacteria bacterium CG_4_9_14_3_um_filter_63_12]